MRTGELTRWAAAHHLLLVACLLSVLTGCAASFALSARSAGHDSAEVLLAANRLERLVTDMETDQLRYVATGDTGFLGPWHAARAAFLVQATALQRLAAENNPQQGRRAREIVGSAMAYLREHAEPLVRMARHDRARAGRAVTWADGKRRIEAIRHQFDRFTDVQHRLALAHERDAVPAIRRMIGMAAGASATLFLIFLLAGYVTRGLTSRAPAGPVHGLRLLRPDRERPGRERARRVSGECEGLRRVATLVARDASPADVFHAGAGEMGRALGAEHAMIARYDPDGMITVVGHWSAQRAPRIMPPLKGRWPVEDDTVADSVCRTGRPAHLRRDAGAVGDIGAWIRTHGIGRMTGHPVVADDRLWGMAVVLSEGPAPWPDGAERTMREFADLFGVALTGSRRRSELLASRVRLVDAADATRGRIERALHERTQQRLVAVGLTLRLVETAVPADQERLREQVSTAVRDVMEIIDGLQEIARELYPAFLTMGGIESSLRALARRASVPVELDVRAGVRPPPNVAVTLYHAVSEALANAAAHAHASAVHVGLDLGEPIRLSIRDDGIGGARVRPGRALAALKDRAEALGGVFELKSPTGGGTCLRLTIPIRDHAASDRSP
ncbi:MAG TPA: CHASE3 domain-containing protein [Actinoallomurus sp.]|nr:CHASE3 domain-containing protein [Actinoallomurus sp.]